MSLNAELLNALLDHSEGWMRSLILAAATLLALSFVYNNRGVRTMLRELSAAARAVGRALLAAQRIDGEKPAGRVVATVNAAVFCALCALVVVEVLLFAAILLTRNYYGVLSLVQFAAGAASMLALIFVARLCRAEAYRALARR